MRWTDRQHTLLQAMGLRLWAPPAAAETDGPVAQPVAVAAPALPATEPAPAVVRPAPPALQPPAAPVILAKRPAATGPAATPTAAVSAADHLDWPELRAAVAGCRACGLCESRRQTVFGVGHPRAHCMVVGEAPGEQEDAQGEPFVGAAGQLLDRMLAALGLGRGGGAQGGSTPATPAQQVFIANTLKCRPPRNRNPSADELAACRPFLQRQVALVQPRVILAMGRFAVQSLLDSDAPIGRLRGTVHRWHGVPLVVTYHPAYLLRQPADKARAWDDLCLAAGLLAQPPGA